MNTPLIHAPGWVQQVRDGQHVVLSTRVLFTLGTGARVVVDYPLVTVLDDVVVGPNIEPSGDAGLVIRFDQWCVGQFGAHERHVQFLPHIADSHDEALALAQAFAADPTVGWGSAPVALLGWVQHWLADRNVTGQVSR